MGRRLERRVESKLKRMMERRVDRRMKSMEKGGQDEGGKGIGRKLEGRVGRKVRGRWRRDLRSTIRRGAKFLLSNRGGGGANKGGRKIVDANANSMVKISIKCVVNTVEKLRSRKQEVKFRFLYK